MKKRILFAILILAMVLGGLIAAFSCGDDDDDDDDGAPPGEDDDDATDDDTTDDDDDTADDDDDTADDDDDTADDDDDATISGNIAYIYDTNDVLALAFEIFLEGEGYTVDLYDVSELTAKVPDFTDVDIFITDNGTEGSWDETNSAVVTGTGKPILANADGMSVFEWMGMYLESGMSMGIDDLQEIVPLNLSHDLWSTPNDLGFGTSDPVEILAAPHHGQSLDDDGSSPAGVEFLGRAVYSGGGKAKDENHYAIVVQDGKYGLWGFGENSPNDYSPAGKDLYVNLIEYLRSAE